jgi:L-arabinose isomerase
MNCAEEPTFLKRWLAEGPTHHFALGVGHAADTIAKIGRALNIETKIVCLRR